MQTTIDEVFTWKENLGSMARSRFGKHGALANSRTYAAMKRRSDEVVRPAWPGFSVLGIYLNSFDVRVKEDIPDGILVPCDCPTCASDKEP